MIFKISTSGAHAAPGQMMADQPDYIYSSPQWDPWGKALGFQQFNMKKETLFLVRSDIQMIAVETGMITILGIIGYQAKWRFP